VINLLEFRVEIYKENGGFLRVINYFEDELIYDDLNKKYIKGYEPQRINVDKINNIYLFHRNSFSIQGGVYSSQGRLIKKGIQVDYHWRGKHNYDEKQMVDFNGFYYELPTKTTDKAILVKDIKNNIVRKCNKVEFATDEEGEIYKTDREGNIYTFDYYDTLDVIKISPFKEKK
jgi:hypothetical protein